MLRHGDYIMRFCGAAKPLLPFHMHRHGIKTHSWFPAQPLGPPPIASPGEDSCHCLGSSAPGRCSGSARPNRPHRMTLEEAMRCQLSLQSLLRSQDYTLKSAMHEPRTASSDPPQVTSRRRTWPWLLRLLPDQVPYLKSLRLIAPVSCGA